MPGDSEHALLEVDLHWGDVQVVPLYSCMYCCPIWPSVYALDHTCTLHLSYYLHYMTMAAWLTSVSMHTLTGAFEKQYMLCCESLKDCKPKMHGSICAQDLPASGLF